MLRHLIRFAHINNVKKAEPHMMECKHGVEIMGKKLMIDIELGSNGGFVVTRYKNAPTSLQKLTGVAQEKEVLAFATAKEFVDYLTRWKQQSEEY
jgi:hypothetical protein